MNNAKPNQFLQDLFNLEGQSFVVTGAASGLGVAMSEALSSSGAAVLMIDQNQTTLNALEQRWRREHPERKVQTAVADVSNKAQLTQAINQFINIQGRIDGLFANAGISGGPGFGSEAGRESGSLLNQEAEDWDRINKINLHGVLSSMQAVIAPMQKQGFGRIIVTASMTGLAPEPFVSYAYMLSKAAVIQLVRQSALEFAKFGIVINAIAPGYIKTNIGGGRLHDVEVAKPLVEKIPLGRLGVPQDIQGLTIFLASRASDYITGITIPIDGGYLLK
jgi:NAD(P)-dependent dehydrogenase (short-subunit alcohol dehydrogenase family)